MNNNAFYLPLDELLTETNRRHVIIDRSMDDNQKADGYGWNSVMKYFRRRARTNDFMAKMMVQALDSKTVNAVIVLYVPQYSKKNGKFLKNYTLAMLPHISLENAPNFMGAPLCGNKLPTEQGIALFHELYQREGEEGNISSFYQMIRGTGKELKRLGAYRPDKTTRHIIMDDLSHAIQMPIREIALLKPEITLYEPEIAFLNATREEYPGTENGPVIVTPETIITRDEAVSDTTEVLGEKLALPPRMKAHADQLTALEGPTSSNVVKLKRTTFKKDGSVVINEATVENKKSLSRWFQKRDDPQDVE